MKRESRDANAAGQRDESVLEIPWTGDCFPQTFCLSLTLEIIAAGHDNDELFAPVSSHRVVRPDYRFQPAGAFAQRRVSRKMPVTVIDLFEMIEIQHEKGDGSAVPGGARQLRLQFLDDAVAVEEAGQSVTAGLFAKGLPRCHQFLLEVQDASPRSQADSQFVSVKRLR